MKRYIEQERAKWWPVNTELMAQYRDGSHTYEDSRGTLFWAKDGLLHRDGDLPAYIGRDGSLEWYQNDLWHRDGDRPAWIHADGILEWLQTSKTHRLHGPARIFRDGTLEWWINDENITLEVNEWLAGEEWQGSPEQIERFQRRFT